MEGEVEVEGWGRLLSSSRPFGTSAAHSSAYARFVVCPVLATSIKPMTVSGTGGRHKKIKNGAERNESKPTYRCWLLCQDLVVIVLRAIRN